MFYFNDFILGKWNTKNKKIFYNNIPTKSKLAELFKKQEEKKLETQNNNKKKK